jgi:hypothetical protein
VWIFLIQTGHNAEYLASADGERDVCHADNASELGKYLRLGKTTFMNGAKGIRRLFAEYFPNTATFYDRIAHISIPSTQLSRAFQPFNEQLDVFFFLRRRGAVSRR